VKALPILDRALLAGIAPRRRSDVVFLGFLLSSEILRLVYSRSCV